MTCYANTLLCVSSVFLLQEEEERQRLELQKKEEEAVYDEWKGLIEVEASVSYCAFSFLLSIKLRASLFICASSWVSTSRAGCVAVRFVFVGLTLP